jgi:hypothetical protein
MRLFLTCTLLFGISPVFGQTHEFGFQAGICNYLGDLAPSFAPSATQEHLGVFYKKNHGSGFIAWKHGLSYGRVSGDDGNFKSNSIRNLDFRSVLVEFSTQFEFNFQKFFIGLRAEKFSPYAFIGLGATYFNPQGSLNGQWHNLRPLSTEGQGLAGGPKPYSNLALVLPMGGGLKWVIGRRAIITLHSGFRYAFTDYLDDLSGTYFDKSTLVESKGALAVMLADKSPDAHGIAGKQRGNPGRNDWYAFGAVSLSFWLNDRNCFNFK